MTGGAASYVNAKAITPNDTTVFDPPYNAVWIGGAGNLVVVLVGGQTLTITAAAVNTIYPFRIKQVLATGTTATGVIGLT